MEQPLVQSRPPIGLAECWNRTQMVVYLARGFRGLGRAQSRPARIHFRSGRLARDHSGVDLLFIADRPVRRRVHPRLCQARGKRRKSVANRLEQNEGWRISRGLPTAGSKGPPRARAQPPAPAGHLFGVMGARRRRLEPAPMRPAGLPAASEKMPASSKLAGHIGQLFDVRSVECARLLRHLSNSSENFCRRSLRQSS